jgi:hypothetical protein
VRPKHRTAFKTPPSSCVLCVCQPEPLQFEQFLSTPWKHTEKLSTYSLILSLCKNIIFDQLYVLAAFLPGKSTLNKGLSLDDVTSSILNFSSVSTFWFKCWACWRNLTGFLSIHSGDKQWKAIHRDVASMSKTCALLPAWLCSEKVCRHIEQRPKVATHL